MPTMVILLSVAVTVIAAGDQTLAAADFLSILAADVLNVKSSSPARAAGLGRSLDGHGQSTEPSRYGTAA